MIHSNGKEQVRLLAPSRMKFKNIVSSIKLSPKQGFGLNYSVAMQYGDAAGSQGRGNLWVGGKKPDKVWRGFLGNSVCVPPTCTRPDSQPGHPYA